MFWRFVELPISEPVRYALMASALALCLFLLWRGTMAERASPERERGLVQLALAIARCGAKPNEIPKNILVAAVDLAEREACDARDSTIDGERFTQELDRYAWAIAARQKDRKGPAVESVWREVQTHAETMTKRGGWPWRPAARPPRRSVK